MTYAENTTVPVERSKAELDKLLSKHGATQRIIGSDDSAGMAYCVFKIANRQVRLRVPVPTEKELQPKRGEEPRGWLRWTARDREDWILDKRDQTARERWRALVLLVKAKLELVALGLSTIEREFLADIYMPDGRTVHEMLAQPLEDAYTSGNMPPMLAAFGKGDK